MKERWTKVFIVLIREIRRIRVSAEDYLEDLDAKHQAWKARKT